MTQNNALGKLGRVILAAFFIVCSLFLLYGDYYKQSKYILQSFSGGFEYYEAVLAGASGEVNEGHYRVTIDGCVGCLATINEGSSVKGYYYAVWLADDSFAVVEVTKEKEAQALEEITNATWDYITGKSDKLTDTPLVLNVEANRISEGGDLSEAYIDFLEQSGITKDKYFIRMTSLSAENITFFKVQKIAEFIACLAFLLAGLLMIISTVAKSVKENKEADESKEALPIDSTEDNRNKEVSHFEAGRRIKSKRLKRNMLKMRIEFLISLIVFVSTTCLMAYIINNHNESGALVRFFDNNSKILLAAIFCSFAFAIRSIANHYTFVDNFKRFSDVDFERLENEIDRNTTINYPQNLYLTDSFIIKLHANRGGAVGKNDVDSFFVKYSDVEWVYQSIIGFEKAKIKDNIGLAIYGRNIGQKVIIRLSGKEESKRCLDEIMSKIVEKNPKIKVGYSEENKKEFEV